MWSPASFLLLFLQRGLLEEPSRLENLPRETPPLPLQVTLQRQIEKQRIVLLKLEDHGRCARLYETEPLKLGFLAQTADVLH